MSRKLTFICTLGLLCPALVLAGDYEVATHKVDAEGAERVEILVEFDAGELWIRSGDITEIARIEIEYDSRWMDYDIDYRKQGSTGQLTLESDFRRGRHDHGDIDNQWQLTLSKTYNHYSIAP